jgi:acyl-CoA reductase-like NAD-dependent aldehyde dehydrogenase
VTVSHTLTGWCTQMEMLIGGRWQPARSDRTEDVTSPFDGTVIGTVPVADIADVRVALERAEAGADIWRRTPAHERMRILLRAADLADERAEQIAQIISAEAGKTITEAGGEAARSGDLIRLAAFEGTQLYGDSLGWAGSWTAGPQASCCPASTPWTRRRGDPAPALPSSR